MVRDAGTAETWRYCKTPTAGLIPARGLRHGTAEAVADARPKAGRAAAHVPGATGWWRALVWLRRPDVSPNIRSQMVKSTAEKRRGYPRRRPNPLQILGLYATLAPVAQNVIVHARAPVVVIGRAINTRYAARPKLSNRR